MTLYIAGINHFDPLCQFELRQWLANLRSEISTPPTFVAVEFSESIFSAIKAQRKEFQELLTNQWPNKPNGNLSTLASSLAYEGDSHLAYFPTTEILWLDRGREQDPLAQRALKSYARDRVSMYTRFLWQNPKLEVTSDAFLWAMSKTAWSDYDPNAPGNSRDSKWAAVILQRMRQGDYKWGIAIVGAAHTSVGKASMSSILEHYGVHCIVNILQP